VQKVDVYFNLHKKVFSVKDGKSGLVTDHSNGVLILNPVFKVSEKGRQRVIKEQRKNVHAAVRGQLISKDLQDVESVKAHLESQGYKLHAATYQPYVCGSFILVDTKEAISQAQMAFLINKKIYVIL